MSRDLIPPQNLDAEQAVLGALMVQRDLFTLVREIVSTADFYAPHHAKLFATFETLHEKDEPFDKVSVVEELGPKDLVSVGGLDFLSQLLDAVPTTASVEYYARIVSEKAQQRAWISEGNAIEAAAFAGDPPADIARRAQERADSILQRSAGVKAHTFAEALKLTDEQNDVLGRESAIPFPLQSLHRISAPFNRERERGMRPGQITTVAAKEKAGKSSCVEMIAATAVHNDARVLFFAIELGIRETIERMAERFSFGHIHDKIQTDAFRIVDNDKPITTETIAALVARHRPDIVIVDQAQHLAGWFEGRKGEGRDMNPTRILHRLNRVARSSRAHFVIAHQINRNADHNEPPGLNDLRETQAFVTLSHRVVLLHRPNYGAEEAAMDNEIVLHIAANRSGPPGKVTCSWVGDRREIVDRISVPA